MKPFVGGSWEVVDQDLVKSALVAASPLWWSCEIFFGVLAWRSCSRFFTCHCEKILWRSCLHSPQEVLAWSSYAVVFVWFFLDAQMKILYEDRRSCCCRCENVSPHLLLFHRYCCLYPVQSLPTFHVVWGLLPVFFLFWEAVFYCVLHVWFWGEEQGYATSTVTGGETFIIGGFKHVFLVHIQRLLLTKGWNPQSVFVIFVNRMVRV